MSRLEWTVLPIQVLDEANVCAADGTFYVRPKPMKRWRQVYAFHAYVNGTFVPCAVAYMTSKSRRFYVRVIDALKDWIALNLELQWAPDYWLTDFESGIFGAVQRVWPGVVHKACYFHFSKAIWTQVQKKGLAEDYNEDVPLNELVCMLKVMPLVPVASVPACVRFIIDQ